MRNDWASPTHRPAYRRASFGGATPLDKLIRQSAPSFILPYPRYFYNKVLKMWFVVIMKLIFPYTNYSCA